MGRVFWGGVLVVILGFVTDWLPVRVYRTYDFWHTSPSFFMIRLGIVMMGLSGMWLYEKRINPRSSVLQVIGQESLFVYALHIILVYGSAIPSGSLVQIFGSSLNFAGSAGVFLGLSTVTCLIAYVWHYLKVKKKKMSRVVQYATIGVIAYLFLTRPY